jgi:hypothetical protein
MFVIVAAAIGFKDEKSVLVLLPFWIWSKWKEIQKVENL